MSRYIILVFVSSIIFHVSLASLISSFAKSPQQTGYAQRWTVIAAASGNSSLFYALVITGLIYKSTDAGYSWVPLSVLNRNWYAMHCSGDGSRVYAGVTGNFIYTSSDYGTSWNATGSPTKNWADISSPYSGGFVAAVNDGYNSIDYIYISKRLRYKLGPIWFASKMEMHLSII